MSREFVVRLETPEGTSELSFASRPVEPLSSLLAARGFPLNTRCGGRGLCAGCECELREGAVLDLGSGKSVSAAGDAPVVVKTCQSRPACARIDLFVPARSLLRHQPEVVSEFRIGVPRGLDPMGRGAALGVAVDIGTTTVALILCDLATGKILATASAFNAQIRFGEDVLTRIQACSTDKGRIAMMQRTIAAETIQPLLREACDKADAAVADVGVMTVAGNTTMMHLFAGVDPTPLGIYPFTPVFLDHQVRTPRELGLEFGSGKAEVHLLPGSAAYVGADITAGIIATGMLYGEEPVMLVDVGTNGEIVLKAGGKLLGCATAAGPAFEGVGLLSGVRGVLGAIERVRLAGPPLRAELGIIGDETRPIGMCGSAYIDFLSEGCAGGLLGLHGRFSARFVDASPELFETGRYGRRLNLHPRGQSGPVWISELDISRLLQAKAAIAAGIQTLLEMAGCHPRDIRCLHLAGGFGMHLSVGHAIGCGLFPGFRPDQIEVVGNTSLAGAMLALTDRNLLAEFSSACAQMEEIELNLQPGFENAFIDNLCLGGTG